MSENSLYRILAAFASAETAAAYRKAKLLMGDLEPLGQLAMVDAARACRKRLLEMGVL